MQSLINLDFNDAAVRTIVKDGAPWFVLNDVCAILEISNSRQAAQRLEDYEKGVANSDTPGGEQELNIINESGIYSLTLTSRKAAAKSFKKWLTTEVLPSIRKTGAYSVHRYTEPLPSRAQIVQDAMPEGLYKPFRLAHADWGAGDPLRSLVADGQLWFILADISAKHTPQAMKAMVKDGDAFLAVHANWPVLDALFPDDEGTYICDATAVYEIARRVGGFELAERFRADIAKHNRAILDAADVDPTINGKAPDRPWNRVRIRLDEDGKIFAIFADAEVFIEAERPTGRAYYDRETDLYQRIYEPADVTRRKYADRDWGMLKIGTKAEVDKSR